MRLLRLLASFRSSREADRGHRRWASQWLATLALAVTLVLPALAQAEPTVQRAQSQSTQGSTPADSPELVGQRVTLPGVPPGYQTSDAGWLQLSYPPSLSHWADQLIRQANDFKHTVTQRLGQPVLHEVHVRLAEDADAMEELAPPGAPYPKYAEGVAYSRLGLILLTNEPLHAAEQHDLPTTFRHELAHVALHDALSGRHIPLWFNEGLAVHLSGENTFARVRALATAAVAGNLLPITELNKRFPNDIVGVPLAYAQSADIVRFLLRTQDQERFRLLLARVRRGQGFDRALSDAYGMDVYNLERAWLENLDDRFSFWPALFSGTVIWTIGVVLVTLAWRRKRIKHNRVMQRWAREEALEEERARRLLALEMESNAIVATQPPPPWVVDRASGEAGRERRDSVPKVEHDGNWHTLH